MVDGTWHMNPIAVVQLLTTQPYMRSEPAVVRYRV
jgi:hypothetical protein